jgi:hypothetical protein
MSDAPSTINAFVSSSEAATEEDVTRLIDWDRAKTVVWKEKGKEDSSNQSGSSSAMGDIMSSLKKLATLFIRTQMWKQYNKLCEVNTATMNVEELVSYWEALKVIKKDLNFVSQNVGDIMSTLKKLATSFIRAQMWKQYNKLCEVNTAAMNVEELVSYREALKLIKKDLNFVFQNVADVQNDDDK